MNTQPIESPEGLPPVPFTCKGYWFPKDEGSEQAYEDGYETDHTTGRIAIADGVSSTIFSRSWANLLTKAATSCPPDVNDLSAVETWLAKLKVAWKKTFDIRKLAWNQRGKLKEYGGGAATLLWIEMQCLSNLEHPEAGPYKVRGFSIGDCCLFHLRNDKVINIFGINSLEDFGLSPKTLSATRQFNADEFTIETWEGECERGDRIMLATDAIAEWFYKKVDRGDEINWHAFDNLTPEEWKTRVRKMRNEDRMRHDDTTLLLLDIGEKDVIIGPTQESMHPEERSTHPGIIEETPGAVGGDSESNPKQENSQKTKKGSDDPSKTSEQTVEYCSLPAQLNNYAGWLIGFVMIEFVVFGTLVDLLIRECLQKAASISAESTTERLLSGPEIPDSQATISLTEYDFSQWIIIGSACLLCSGPLLQLACSAGRRGRLRTQTITSAISILLAIGFLLCIGYGMLIDNPLSPNLRTIAGTIQVLMGLEALHVLAGITFITANTILVTGGTLHANSISFRLMLWYWNFIVGTWLTIFTVGAWAMARVLTT